MKVCILHQIPGEAKELLEKEGYGVVFGEENLAGANAVLSLLTDRIGADFFDKAGPGLSIVANYAVGYDNIDVAEAAKRHIFITNTPGGFETAVAEHAVGLMLAVGRKIVVADRFVRGGDFARWDPNLFLGIGFFGKTIGIVGLGRIGSAMARICEQGLGMKVLTYSRSSGDLDSLLAASDVVSLHVPLTNETRHLISTSQFSRMKRTAILVNTARGAVVDEMALVTALREKWILGAGLDVFEDETKLLTESEKILYSLDNVVLTPHIASGTLEARSSMAEITAQNIIDALSGQKPRDLLSAA